MRPVLVLCGGRGERLRSVIDDRPKVLAPVGDALFLGHLIERLLREGVKRIVLCSGYRAEEIAEYVGARPDWSGVVQCVAEAQPLGTGGALAHALRAAAIEGEFFALNGDTWFDGALAELAAAHEQCGAHATLSLAAVEDVARYGRVAFDEDSGAVTAFVEKDGRSEAGWINAGQYLLDSDLLADLPRDRPVSLERDVLPRWIGRGLFVRLFERAHFLDIGTPEDYARAERVLSASRGRP